MADNRPPPRAGRRRGASVIEVGTMWGGGRKVFAAVHPDTPRGVRVVLEGSSYQEWIVGCADPETVAQAIMAPLTGRTPPA